MKAFLAIALGFLVLGSGCLNQQTLPPGSAGQFIQEVAGFEEIADLLTTYPDANLTATLASSVQIEGQKAFYKEKCGENFEAKNYWIVELAYTNAHATFLFQPGIQVPSCVFKESSATGACLADEDCTDGILSTQDTCDKKTKACENKQVTACIAGDYFCPSQCTKNTDSDCEAECNFNAECNDLNASTTDLCLGQAKKVCAHIPFDYDFKQFCGNAQSDVGENCDTCVEDIKCAADEQCIAGFCVKPETDEEALDEAKELAVLNVKAEPGPGSVVISWETSKPATGEIIYGEGSNPPSTLVKETNVFVKKHSLSLQGLKPVSAYTFFVRSVDTQNNSVSSPLKSFNTK
ncbi:MAG: fibronectin type III domain-containing protein [Candidatus Diapherotrites archaeon]|nr:fibronectin type III domain-containing protein [Candidatus Diapherotrites archaeon]